MKEKLNSNGFVVVGLSIEGNVKNVYVHDLVFNEFFEEGDFLEHKDFNKANNSVDNLVGIKDFKCDFNSLTGKLSEDDLTQEVVKDCFDYEDGQLIWKLRPPEHFKELSYYRCFRTESVGKVAGYFNKRIDSNRKDFGYWRTGITLGGAFSNFKLHRLIYFWHHGTFPDVVDHKDCDQNNNRIENLRAATHKSNSQNTRTNHNSVTGYKGVSVSKSVYRINKPYRASIMFNGYSFHLGDYECKHRAARAYNLASDLLFKNFSNVNKTPCEDNVEDFFQKFFTIDYPKIKNGTFNWESKTKRGKK